MKEFKFWRVLKKASIGILAALVLFATMNLGTSYAAQEEEDESEDYVYYNTETGYEARVCDYGNLITDMDAGEILLQMVGITEYGNAIYLTMDGYVGSSDTARKVKDFYYSNYGPYVNGVVYCAHANKNKEYEPGDYEGYDYLYTEGDIYDVVGIAKCNIITDNVYDMYYTPGAKEAFREVYTLLSGGKIAQPMRYISNALLGLVLAFFISFLIVNHASKLKRYNPEEMIKGSVNHINIRSGHTNFVNQTRKYVPRSSSGGGHGGHGGGHGGGGGHSH